MNPLLQKQTIRGVEFEYPLMYDDIAQYALACVVKLNETRDMLLYSTHGKTYERLKGLHSILVDEVNKLRKAEVI